MNLRANHPARRSAAFTMVEIAICLAVIGLALVAIIGVLPVGMRVQRDNREETVINQDASVLLESIRNGVRGGDDLTNYVYAITNYVTEFGSNNMNVLGFNVNGYTLTSSYVNGAVPVPSFTLSSNICIVGLLSTPEFLTFNGYPTNNLMSGGYSNHVEAYVHALSGPAVEKPPQDNSILIEDSFTYRVRVVNAPVATDTNLFGFTVAQQAYSTELAANLHEVSLSFFWPLEPNGSVGTGRQTQRTMVSGTIIQTNFPGQYLYFYQSQSFVNTP